MIPNQQSLNRFIIEVNELCASHEMVQQSLFGDILRLYSQQQQKYYSIMWDFTTGSIDEKFVNLTAQFVVSGWVYSDYSNVENVKSDCQKIASDIFSGVQYSRRWQMIGKVNGSFNLEPFIERTGDKVAGWVVTMNFRLKRKHGICDVPFGDYDFDKDPTNGGNPVLIFENDILVATLYGGDTYYYTSGGTCDPVTSRFNTIPLQPTPSGENKDITVKYENNSLVGSIVTDTPNSVIIEVPNPIICADGTVLINGVVVGTVSSGGMLNTAVENEDGTPLGSFIDGVWVVPNCPPTNYTRGAKPTKTGQLVSYVANDDGATKRGREVDFYNLTNNNFFGHKKRFSGTTGGYQNETNSLYYDVNGNVTTRALAFPEEIILDWSTWESDNIVYGYLISQFSNQTERQTFNNWGLNSPYNTASWSGFVLVNTNEIKTLVNESAGDIMNYPPFNWTIISNSLTYLWTCTSRASSNPTDNAWLLSQVGFQALAKTQLARCMLMRQFNTSEL
jgi:hypothetical protein